MTQISMIACIDERFSIGYNNRLLFKNKDDINWFKEKTMNKTIIMGRHTYESIGRPLKGRINLVLTSNKEYNPHPSVLVRHSIADVFYEFGDEPELVVVGGSQVYNQFMPYATKLYITKVHHRYEKSDSWFPNFTECDWQEIYFKEMKSDMTPFTFHTYKKRMK